jgi:hypothetical protein
MKEVTRRMMGRDDENVTATDENANLVVVKPVADTEPVSFGYNFRSLHILTDMVWEGRGSFSALPSY